MTTCLKYLVPISCFLFLGAIVWPLVMLSALGQTTWTSSPLGKHVAAEVRESQVIKAQAAKAASVPAAAPVPSAAREEGVVR